MPTSRFNTKYLLQQSIFILKFRYAEASTSFLRKCWYTLLGMRVGRGTKLPPLNVTWPHQVIIGANCTLEQGIYLKYDGIWQHGSSIIINNNVFIGSGCEFNITEKITIGDNTLIASGCRFIDHNHGAKLGTLMRLQQCASSPIKIHSNVWLGCNVVVLQGVEIESGAIVAAGAVVTRSIPADEIWAGVPARKIGQRKS